jgi:ADP-heptose:LPS heptosyltransferase
MQLANCNSTDKLSILCVSIGGLGDAVLFSPVLKAIKYKYNNACIDLLVSSPLVKEIYSHSEIINQIYCVDLKNQNLLQKSLSLLMAVCRRSLPRNYGLGLFAARLNPNLSLFLRLLGVVKQSRIVNIEKKSENDLTATLRFSKDLCGESKDCSPFVPINKESVRKTLEVLDREGVDFNKNPVLTIYPSTDLWHRPRMELSHLIRIAKKLKLENKQIKIAVVGSFEEGKQINESDVEGIVDVNLAGKIPIGGVAYLFSKSKLAICNDGGLMHVAGAVNCPLIAIMVNTPLAYKPAGSNTHVFRSVLNCCKDNYPKRPSNCAYPECRDHIPEMEIINVGRELLHKDV